MDIGAVERAREQAQEYKDDKKLLQEIQELKEAVDRDQLSREILVDHARQLEKLLELLKKDSLVAQFIANTEINKLIKIVNTVNTVVGNYNESPCYRCIFWYWKRFCKNLIPKLRRINSCCKR